MACLLIVFILSRKFWHAFLSWVWPVILFHVSLYKFPSSLPQFLRTNSTSRSCFEFWRLLVIFYFKDSMSFLTLREWAERRRERKLSSILKLSNIFNLLYYLQYMKVNNAMTTNAINKLNITQRNPLCISTFPISLPHYLPRKNINLYSFYARPLHNFRLRIKLCSFEESVPPSTRSPTVLTFKPSSSIPHSP